MRKVLCYTSVLLLACASSALAGGPEVVPVVQSYANPFDGFNVGIYGVYGQTSFDANSSTAVYLNSATNGNNNNGFPFLVTQDDHPEGGSDFNGLFGAQVGWGKTFGCVLNGFGCYAGLSVFGQMGSAGDSFNETTSHFGDLVTENSNTNVSVGNSVGIVFKPGIVIAQKTMAYGKIGAIDSQIKVDNTYSVSGPTVLENLIDVGTEPATVSDSQNKWGFIWGVGVEHFLTDRFTINAEYNHVYYSTIDTGTGDGQVFSFQTVDPKTKATTITSLDTTTSASVKTQSSNFLFGLNYYL